MQHFFFGHFLNYFLNNNVDNQHQVDNDAASQISRATANNSVDANTPRTFAAVVASPTPPKPHAHNQDADKSESDTITITVGERSRAPPTRPPHEEVPYHDDTTTHTSGFKAARRKNIMSYFIGNIDTYSTKQDIYDYMKANKVIPTFINVFYGRNGAAAKINIHADDQEKVDNDYFWPSDIIVRKWVSKEEWEKERPRTHRRPRRQRYQHWRYDSTDNRAYDAPDERAPRYRSYAYRDGHRSGRNGHDNHRSYHDNDNDFSRDDWNSDDEWDPESRY